MSAGTWRGNNFMDDLLKSITDLVPEKYRHTVALLVLASPYLTRGFSALRTGGGLRGALMGIWFGTNVPKEVKAMATGNTNQFQNPNHPKPKCPCCGSSARVELSPAESAFRGRWFCPCNAPGSNESGHFNA